MVDYIFRSVYMYEEQGYNSALPLLYLGSKHIHNPHLKTILSGEQDKIYWKYNRTSRTALAFLSKKDSIRLLLPFS